MSHLYSCYSLRLLKHSRTNSEVPWVKHLVGKLPRRSKFLKEDRRQSKKRNEFNKQIKFWWEIPQVVLYWIHSKKLPQACQFQMNLNTHLKTRRLNHLNTLKRILRCYKNIQPGESRHKVVLWSLLETATQWKLILHNTISRVLTIENSVTDYKADIQLRDHLNHRHQRRLKI